MNTTDTGATFSDCKEYRYRLWRIWDEEKPKVMIIGLNPSTANETKNDNTISKVVKVAEYNGYGGVFMVNLFAVISKNPEILLTHLNPIGRNDFWLHDTFEKCRDVVFAWGAFPEAKERAKIVIGQFSNPLCFAQNKDKSPKHPLYCLDKTNFIPFI